MARGGLIEAASGMVSGDTDYLPELGRRLEAMARAVGRAIHVASGGRTMAEQAGLYASKGPWSPTNPGVPPPNPNAPHIRGIAADISPGRDIFGAIAQKFGLVFPVGNEPWHVELAGGRGCMFGKLAAGALAAAGGGGGGGAAAWSDFAAPKTDMAGQIGAVVQATLNKVTQAANAKGAQLAGSFGGGTSIDLAGVGLAGLNRVFPAHLLGEPGVTLSAAQVAAIAQAVGLPAEAFEQIARGESGYQPGIVSFDGGHGLWQMTPRVWGEAAIAHMNALGGIDAMRNPFKNAQMAKYLYEAAGNTFAPWKGTRFLGTATGGLIEAANGMLSGPTASASGTGDTIIGLGDPKAPDKPRKDRNTKPKPKKPVFTPRKPPKLAGIRGKIKPGRGKPRLPKWLLNSELDDGQGPVLVPDYDQLWGRPIGAVEAEIRNMLGRFDLTEEQDQVELYDSDQFPDLTNYLQANPKTLGKLSLDEWMEENGGSLIVDNAAGVTVQGEFVPGRQQALGELGQLLARHQNPEEPKGLLDMLQGYYGATQEGMPKYSKRITELSISRRSLGNAWRARKKVFEKDKEERSQLLSKGKSWQQRVADNDARIDALNEWLRDLREGAAGGNRLAPATEKQRAWAQNRITEMRDESARLKERQPAPLLAPPRKPGPKATKQQKDGYQQQLEDYRERVRERDAKLRRLNDQIRDSREVLTRLADSPASYDHRRGIVGQYTSQIDSYRQDRRSLQQTGDELIQTSIPDEELTIAQLQKDVAWWSKGHVRLPAVKRMERPSFGGRDEELAGLLREQLTETRRSLAVSQAQFDVFRGFAPLAGQRFVGSFMQGTQRVAHDGLALVHEGETITPNPQGGYANSLQAQAGPVHVTLVVEGDAAPFMKQVRAEVNGRVAQIEQQGRRSRLIANAPGGSR